MNELLTIKKAGTLQMKLFVLAFVILLSSVPFGQGFAGETNNDVFVMSFFRGNGEAGVYLAVSEDGKTFNPLNNDQPVMKPAPWENQNLTRDPSVVYHDGLFHMVWTTSWSGPCFGYATSKDLVEWSEPVRVEPFGSEIKPQSSWAPEICWDPIQTNFMIFWSARLDPKVGHRVYLTRTPDGKSFSKATLFLDRDYRCIDSALVLDEPGERWIMAYKNEEESGKNLRIATAPLDFSKPWNDLGVPIIGRGTPICSEFMTEGPSILKKDDSWWIYWDAPKGKIYGMASSKDLINWTDHTDELTLPPYPRHGTVFRAPRSAVGWLKSNPTMKGIKK